ncbi:MAG: hypothetical protein IPK83_05445 [Planctomycetes bacterium]|nr:hypothetical protein [Planctomycetota bacterium]
MIADIDGGLFGFEKKLALAADAEGVVRGFGLAGDFDAVFVDDFAVLLGIALTVVDVPAELGEHGIDVVDADFCFVVVGGADLVGLMVELVQEAEDFVGALGHGA